jgi:MYXO-CTERM domain-containing protein
VGIVNRRNAVLGWAAWTVGKQVAKSKARRAVPASKGEKPKQVRNGAVVVAAAAAALGAAAFWRRRSGGDDAVAELAEGETPAQ